VSLADFTRELVLYPQVLINVPVSKGFDFRQETAVQTVLGEAERELDGSGRVLLRPSGTEPVVRVMVEGKDQSLVHHWAERIAGAVSRAAAAAG
jgi:phosphoglucosamine mutase